LNCRGSFCQGDPDVYRFWTVVASQGENPLPMFMVAGVNTAAEFAVGGDSEVLAFAVLAGFGAGRAAGL
jgi:hypothetical protein